MGLLNRLIEDDESAAEKIDRLRKRQKELQSQLADAEERLDELEGEIAEATAAGAEDEVADRREERTKLRDQVADLTSALEVVEAKVDDLAPEFLRERMADLAEEYEREYGRAEDALDALEDDIADALEGVMVYFGHLNAASDAGGEMLEVRDRLQAAGAEGEIPVNTDHTDRRLLEGRPRYLCRAVGDWVNGDVMENYRSEVDQ